MENKIKVGEYKSVVACPVCYGRGFVPVPAGFYESTGLTWVSTTTGNETCRRCSGKGYIKL